MTLANRNSDVAEQPCNILPGLRSVQFKCCEGPGWERRRTVRWDHEVVTRWWRDGIDGDADVAWVIEEKGRSSSHCDDEEVREEWIGGGRWC